MTDENTVKVHYYRVKEGSDLYEGAVKYLEACEQFVEKIEGFFKEYGDVTGAVSLEYRGEIGLGSAYFPNDPPPSDEALKHWEREDIGVYRPKTSLLEKEFEAIRLSPLSAFCDKGVIEDTRVGRLGDVLVAACTPNKDGSIPKLEGAELITDAELTLIQMGASGHEQETFSLNGAYEQSDMTKLYPVLDISQNMIGEAREWGKLSKDFRAFSRNCTGAADFRKNHASPAAVKLYDRMHPPRKFGIF